MVFSRLLKAGSVLTVLAALSVGCGDSGGDDNTSTTGNDASTGNDAGSSTGNDAGSSTGNDAGSSTGGNATAGKSKASLCVSCHGADLAGNAQLQAPNITPDKSTGIGDWSTQQIVDAIIKNVDDEGQALCANMAVTKSTSQADALDIAAYLKSVPAVSKDVPDTCK